MPKPGWLLTYLPEIYGTDPNMREFLRRFESIWEYFDSQIDYFDSYFDPHQAPVKSLPWLSTWVGLALDENLREHQKRELLGKAIWLHQRQGTVAALRELLRISVGAEKIEIHDQADNNNAQGQFRVTVYMANSVTDPQDRKGVEQRVKDGVKRIVAAERLAYAQLDSSDNGIEIKWL